VHTLSLFPVSNVVLLLENSVQMVVVAPFGDGVVPLHPTAMLPIVNLDTVLVGQVPNPFALVVVSLPLLPFLLQLHPKRRRRVQWLAELQHLASLIPLL
jgi:hypothetical protein